MKPVTLLLILVSLVSFVAGQLLLKSAVGDEDSGPQQRPAPPTRRFPGRAAVFAGGIFGMTISFFVNLGLLQHLDLSFLFPFQGLSVIIVTLGACFFLRERLSAPLVIGALLITAGVRLVSAS